MYVMLCRAALSCVMRVLLRYLMLQCVVFEGELISCLSHAYGAFLNSTEMCQRIRILPSCVFIVLVRLGVLLMFMVPYHQKGHFKGNRDVSLCLPTQTIFLQINVSYLLQIRFQGNLFLEHPTTASAGTKRWDLLSSLATSHCWHPCFGVGTRIAFWPSQTVGLSARHFLLPICFGMA